MPLQGDLKEFGVPEIFQLLEQQDKTGCLLLTMESLTIEVYFRDGMLVGAIPDGLSPAEHLLGTLDSMGFLAETKKGKIRDLYEKDLRGLPEILQQQDIIEQREMDLLLKEKIEEILFPIFLCRIGKFFFDQDRALSSEWSISHPLAVEPIILEGLRQTDEWPLLKKRLGSFQEIPRRQIITEGTDKSSWAHRVSDLFRRTPKREKNQAEPLEKDLFPDQDGSLSSAEKMVYNLIDGKKNIEEILRVSSLGEFSTCNALLGLRGRGWIRIDKPLAQKRRPVMDAGRAGLGKWVLSAAALIVFFLAVSFFGHSGKVTWVQGLFREEARPVYRLLNRHQRVRVVCAIEMYEDEYGSVPARLSDLVKMHLIHRNDLSLWGDNIFSYTAETPSDFHLLIVPAP